MQPGPPVPSNDAHAVRKVPPNGAYRVQDDYGAKDYKHPLTNDICEFARTTLQKACTVLGENEPPLYARVDLLSDAEGTIYLNELEVIEPSLFFRHNERLPQQLHSALMERIS